MTFFSNFWRMFRHSGLLNPVSQTYLRVKMGFFLYVVVPGLRSAVLCVSEENPKQLKKMLSEN